MTPAIPAPDLARLKSGPVFLSCSGGKDSTAAGLWLLENGISFRAVFADTGWEHPDTYAYVDGLERLFGKIERVGYPGGMRALIEERGFASKTQRFCTDYLKRRPLALWQFHNAPSAKRQAPSAKRQAPSAKRQAPSAYPSTTSRPCSLPESGPMSPRQGRA